MAKGDLSLFVQSIFADQHKKKLTDEQIVKACVDKFPRLAENDHFIQNVKGYRRGYNRGILPLQESAPKTLVGEYLADGTMIEAGKRGPKTGAKAEKAKVEKASPKAAKIEKAKSKAKLVLKKK